MKIEILSSAFNTALLRFSKKLYIRKKLYFLYIYLSFSVADSNPQVELCPTEDRNFSVNKPFLGLFAENLVVPTLAN